MKAIICSQEWLGCVSELATRTDMTLTQRGQFYAASLTIQRGLMRPFLKWAGGKYRIIDRIKATIPNGTRLVEPFVGSGTLFLNTEFDQYLLTDINNDLINPYKIIQKEGLDFTEKR